MIKNNFKTMILTSIIILIPILVGLIIWEQLPAELAVHFNQNGEPDNWTSKEFAVFGLPLILLAVHWFCVAFTGVDPKNKNISNKMVMLVLWICPVISLIACGATYMYALDNSINSKKMGMMFLGCIFIVVGNYLPKMKQSYTIGLKLPWTLNSEENWNRTHRLAGVVFMIAGIIVLIAGFLNVDWMAFVVLLLATMIPTAYSYMLYKKGI